MPITLAQLDAVQASKALMDAASAGDTMRVLSMIIIGLVAYSGFVTKLLLAEKNLRISDEKEHSKKTEDTLKGLSGVMNEILTQIRSAGGR